MNEIVSMSQAQQSAADLWHLEAGTAMRLPLGPEERVLSVVEGRVWLTVEGREDELPEDIWLEPGQTVQLHGARSLVAEASPRASFRLSVPQRASTSAKAWWRGLASRAI